MIIMSKRRKQTSFIQYEIFGKYKIILITNYYFGYEHFNNPFHQSMKISNHQCKLLLSDESSWCSIQLQSWIEMKEVLWSSQLDHCCHQENDWKHINWCKRSWAEHFEWKSSILIWNSGSCSQLIYVTSLVDVFESRYETALSIKPQSDTLAVEWTFYLNFHE